MMDEESEQRLFDTLRRDPWESVFIKIQGLNVEIFGLELAVKSFLLWAPKNPLEEVRQYGWTPEEFIEYAREHYGKDSITK